jgi:ABC-type long-subunit fatty acid transport system fused permease/ATPase subunit
MFKSFFAPKKYRRKAWGLIAIAFTLLGAGAVAYFYFPEFAHFVRESLTVRNGVRAGLLALVTTVISQSPILRTVFTNPKYRIKAYSFVLLLGILLAGAIATNLELLEFSKKINDFWSGKKLTKEDFFVLLTIVALLVARWVVIDPADKYFSRKFAQEWRKAITDDFDDKLGSTKHPERFKDAPQLIQEKVFECTRFLEDVGFGAIRSVFLLLMYIPMLWDLSPKFKIPWRWGYDMLFAIELAIGVIIAWCIASEVKWVLTKVMRGRIVWFLTALSFYCSLYTLHQVVNVRPPWTISGILVIIVVVGSIVGGLISYKIGRPLVIMDKHNQAKEQENRHMREDVVSGNQGFDRIALEASKEAVYASYDDMWLRSTPFDAWNTFYWKATDVLQVFVVGGLHVAKIITFGSMIQIGGLFGGINGNLATFFNNWSRILNFLAMYERIQALSTALDKDLEGDMEYNKNIVLFQRRINKVPKVWKN